jgi:phage terminase small subunit
MTPKQAAFVDEYVVDFNATQAAIRAGYSERSAYNIGYQTLHHPEVAIAIEARLAALAIDPESVGLEARGRASAVSDVDAEGEANAISG